MKINKATQSLIIIGAVAMTLAGFWIFWGSKKSSEILTTQSLPDKNAVLQNRGVTQSEAVSSETVLPEATAKVDKIVDLTDNQLLQEESYLESEEDALLVEQSELDDFGQSFDADEL